VVWVRTESSIRRPAFVVSPAAYTERTGFVLVCEIAEEACDYPFEVAMPAGLDGCTVILADRIRCLHARSWGAMRIDTLEDEITAAVLTRLVALTGPPTD
jgi:mRNA interferase MazF